jgi:hypothetical protein
MIRVRWTNVISSNGVQSPNFVTKGRRFVDDELEEIMGRGLAGEEFEFTVDCVCPRNHNAQCNDERTTRIKPYS